jgi:hypothetical protein
MGTTLPPASSVTRIHPLDHSVSVPQSISEDFIVMFLSSFQLWHFSSYQHVIKRLLYKWAVCDTYIVNSTNLDKMALRDTHAAVKSDTRGILRIWVTYTADIVCENEREREMNWHTNGKRWWFIICTNHLISTSSMRTGHHFWEPKFRYRMNSFHTVSKYSCAFLVFIIRDKFQITGNDTYKSESHIRRN